MSEKTTMKPLAIAAGAAFVTTLAGTPIASAAENPFAMSELSGGYMVAEAGEGKCGGEKKAAEEGKCGGEKEAAEEEKSSDEKKAAGEGKCGEAKCGANK